MASSRIQLRPSEINFTQNSIADHFQSGVALEDTFRQLVNGSLKVDGIQLLQVAVNEQGRYVAVYGNRRLYLYKKLEEYGYITTIPVLVIPISQLKDDKLTTTNGGRTVKVRVGRNGIPMHHRLKVIVDAQRSSSQQRQSSTYQSDWGTLPPRPNPKTTRPLYDAPDGLSSMRWDQHGYRVASSTQWDEHGYRVGSERSFTSLYGDRDAAAKDRQKSQSPPRGEEEGATWTAIKEALSAAGTWIVNLFR